MGEVLRDDDPRAWQGRGGCSGVLGARVVRAKVRETAKLRVGLVPVLWHFEVPTVHWERVAGLRRYDEDLAMWRRERRRVADAEAVAREVA